MTLILVCFTLLCSGCADLIAREIREYRFNAMIRSIVYTPKTVTIPALESAAISREDQGLQVGVNPYVEAEKTQQIFDADLKKARILALQVMVRNNGQRRMTVRMDDFILHLPARKDYTPASSADAAMRLDRSTWMSWKYAFSYWGRERIRKAEEKANTDRRADFLSKEFQDAPLAPDQAAHGFLFYLIPDDVRELRNASLLVKGTHDVPAAGISVELPLGDLGAW
jgi:hypothetical protein